MGMIPKITPPVTRAPIVGAALKATNILGFASTVVAVAGLLGGDAARDSGLAKMGMEYDPNTGLSRPISTPNTGYRQGGVATPPPFQGGQVAGAEYKVTFLGFIDATFRPNQHWIAGNYEAYGVGAIASIRVDYIAPSETDPRHRWEAIVEFGNYTYRSGFFGLNGSEALSQFSWGVENIVVTRLDGQPDISLPSVGGERISTGNTSDDENKSPVPIIYDAGSLAGIGSGDLLGLGMSRLLRGAGDYSPNNIGGLASGLATGINTGLKIQPVITPDRPTEIPVKRPDTKDPKKPDRKVPPPPVTTPKKKDDEQKVPFFPPSSNGGLDGIRDELTRIGTISALIKANTDPVQMKQNTCEVLNSDPCTQKLKNDIRNPINQNIDANRAMTAGILGNQVTQNAAIGAIAAEQAVHKGMLTSIISKLGDVFIKVGDVFNLVGKAFNNSVFDRAMQYITLITVIHNATMLTQSIGSTLGTALDQGLQAFGLQARMQDKDGVVTGVNAVIGKSFENLIKAIIGQERYTQLDETWKKANRVYQASINLVSNVQSILDSTTAVAELSCNRVGILMNALRNSGMVREEAYGLQSQNVTKFNAFMNKLEALEQGTSNLAAITGNIVSTQQAVNEFKSNRQELEDALKNKDKGNGAPENTPEKEALKEKREETLFTIKDFSIVRPPEQT
jgi:hypothetical protein